MLWVNGILDSRAALLGAQLAPGYYGGMVLGMRLFSRFNDTRFRQFTLVLMMVVSAAILLA